MKKQTKFAIISVLSFAISASFTIALFTSNSVGKTEKLIMIVSAIVFEISKWTLLWEGFSDKHTGALRTTLITLWALVTVGSIVASCGYVLNQSNKTQNQTLVSSTEYKQAEQSRNILIDNYNKKSTEIEQLKEQAAELPRNYYSMKQQIMDKVASKTAELSAMATKIQSPIKVEAPLLTNGYSAFFSLMGKVLEEDSKMIELWFFMILGIVLEAIANVFAYLYQKEINHAPKTAETQPEGESKRYFLRNKSRNKIRNKPSFAPNVVQIKNYAPKNVKVQPEPDLYDECDIENYIRVMHQNQKNGYSPGTKSMAQLLGWGRQGEEKARGIKNYLELKGKVRVINNRTQIVKEA